METGKAAPTWLDTHLDGETRWAAGVPADAPPWVTDAFDGLATLTDDELISRADALDAADPTADDGSVHLVDADLDAASQSDFVWDVPAGESSGVGVGEWLLAEPGFVEADDVAFVVDDDALADGLGDDPGRAVANDVPDPLGATAASSLIDPFDLVDEQSGRSTGALDEPDPAERPAGTAAATTITATDDHVVPGDDIATPTEVHVDDIAGVPGPSADIVVDPSGSGAPDPTTDAIAVDDVTVEPAVGDAIDGDAGPDASAGPFGLSDVFDLDPIATSPPADLDGPEVMSPFEHVDDDGSSAGFVTDDDDPWHDGPAEWVDD